MFGISWSADKFLTIGYFVAAGLGALFPISVSYLYKLLVDNLTQSQKISATVPFIVIVVIASRYLISLIQNMVEWAIKETYFDYLLRYKLQNRLNQLFSEKLSNIDIQHLEDSKILDLITKASDTFTWRPPDLIRAFSYLFTSIVSFVSSFILLSGYGWHLPIIITLFGLPRFYLRAKQGEIQWSIYGGSATDARKLWYLKWLLSSKDPIIESRIFQSRDALLKKFEKIQHELYEKNKKPVVTYLKRTIFPEIFEKIVLLIFALNRLPSVLSGAMGIGDFTFFLDMLSRVAGSVSGMVGNLGWVYENNLYVNHFFEVLNLKNVIKVKSPAIDIPENPYPPKIEFRNVSFSYPKSKKKAIDDLSFIVKSGENVAIVGENGAGKTTIVKLLCRFYDVTEGEILINGVNIKDLDLAKWYSYLGTLFQEFVHYDFTVKENITLSEDTDSDESRIIEAARKSGSLEFINKLPKKFDQQLGKQFDDGTELSQGQWQKIAIARAFYESAPVLILDEPTSAIDAEAEYKIFNNLHTSYKDKSLLFISHRFSTVRNADKILVFKAGKLIESGNHSTLLKKGGLYAKLFNIQASAYAK